MWGVPPSQIKSDFDASRVQMKTALVENSQRKSQQVRRWCLVGTNECCNCVDNTKRDPHRRDESSFHFSNSVLCATCAADTRWPFNLCDVTPSQIKSDFDASMIHMKTALVDQIHRHSPHVRRWRLAGTTELHTGWEIAWHVLGKLSSPLGGFPSRKA